MTLPAAKTRDLPQTRPTAKLGPGAAAGLRPAVLNPLFAGLASLPGVGPAIIAALASLLDRPSPRSFDLLGHLPTAAIDPSPLPSPALATPGEMVTLLAEIESHRAPPQGARMPHRILASAGGEPLELAFFGSRTDHLSARFAPGAAVLIHGQLGRFGDRWQMTHPQVLDPRRAADGLLPVYRLRQGLGQQRFRAIVGAALDRLPDLPEWLPGELRAAATAGRDGPRPCGPRTVRLRQRRSSPRRRPASAWPSTSCWPASWR